MRFESIYVFSIFLMPLTNCHLSWIEINWSALDLKLPVQTIKPHCLLLFFFSFCLLRREFDHQNTLAGREKNYNLLENSEKWAGWNTWHHGFVWLWLICMPIVCTRPNSFDLVRIIYIHWADRKLPLGINAT